MICDGEPDLLELFNMALRSKYNIITASSGCQCIEKYSQEKRLGNRIDVVMVDYRLGDILGDEVACKIKQLNGTKVVLISAYEVDKSLIAELLTKGCIVDIIKKPISISSILSKLEQLVCQMQ